LNDVKNRNKLQIDKLSDNVDRLNSVCNEQDQSLKNLEFERNKLQKRYDDLSFEQNNTLGKLKTSQDNLNYTKGVLDEANKKINHLQVNLLYYLPIIFYNY